MQNRRNFFKLAAAGLVAATFKNASFAGSLKPVAAQTTPVTGLKKPVRTEMS
jgi:hypothetical protein